jgi:branched-chain amino acid transport system ATP-binding protein
VLNVDGIDVYYGDLQVLHSVSLDVNEGEIVAVVGANGAGKSTLLKSISGVLKPKRGTITFYGKLTSGMSPDKIVANGIVQVPEGRLLFPGMTVRENLEMGGYLIDSAASLTMRLDRVFELFPVLKERSRQIAGTLSGGEQQMLAIGRALMPSPRLIMFDEPSLGLAPKLVATIFEMVVRINLEMGATVLLVEQNVAHSCEISRRGFVIENGEVVLEGDGKSLLNNDHVKKAYLGL